MGKSTEIPPPDPRLYDALDKQALTADRMVEFTEQTWKENQVRLADQDALNRKVIDQQMRLADSAETRANDAYQFYQNKGRPVVEQALEDAKGWDSEQNLAAARGRATASATQQFDNAQAMQQRGLQRMGINPNSGKFAALNNQAMVQRSLGTAAMANGADEARRGQGAAMRQNASNIAQGLSAGSMGWAGQSGGMGSSAAGIGSAGINTANSVQNAAIGGMSSAGNMFGSNASGHQAAYNSVLQGNQAQQQADQAAAGGVGQLVGMAAMFMADGGKVQGPGTGTSDSVPAVNKDTGQRIQLSNGEYVIPADVVKAKGSEFFQKLIQQYHQPVGRSSNLRAA